MNEWRVNVIVHYHLEEELEAIKKAMGEILSCLTSYFNQLKTILKPRKGVFCIICSLNEVVCWDMTIRKNKRKKTQDEILTLFRIVGFLVMVSRNKKIIPHLKHKYEVSKVSKILTTQLMVDVITICLYFLDGDLQSFITILNVVTLFHLFSRTYFRGR